MSDSMDVGLVVKGNGSPALVLVKIFSHFLTYNIINAYIYIYIYIIYI